MSLSISICVPFTPADLVWISPALTNFLNALTITVLVMPYFFANWLVTTRSLRPFISWITQSTALHSKGVSVVIAWVRFFFLLAS